MDAAGQAAAGKLSVAFYSVDIRPQIALADKPPPMSQTESPHCPRNAFIFFADVAQSTVLYDRLGDEAAAELMMHCLHRATECVLASHGRPIETRGDEILCLFDGVEDVLAAANELHELAGADARLHEHHMAFRIGIHHGPVIEHLGNLYGDAVNVAARMASKAKAHQTLLSSNVTACFADEHRERIRPLGETSVRGKQGAQELFELLSASSTAEITEVSSRAPQRRRAFLLTLKFRNRQVRLTPLLVRHLLGRGADCDLRVEHPSISRHHAEIRFRDGVFVLVDMSTNGSQVRTPTETVNVLRNEVPLPREGAIILGRTETDRHLQVQFVTDDLG